MKSLFAVLLLSLSVLAQVPKELAKTLKQIAGSDAVDCGVVAADADAQKASKCAINATQEDLPFLVIYTDRGVDSALFTAFVSNRVNVYQILYNSAGWRELVPGKPLNARIMSRECTGRVLTISPAGRLTCNPTVK